MSYSVLHAAVLQWYGEQGRDLPWRRTRDPYRVLVSEMMLQQTQVDRVLPKYAEFLDRFPTFADLAAAPDAEVIRAWQGLGYNLRAVRLQRIARQVVERYAGKLPDTLPELLSLDGIGPYTAGAVASFAFGLPEPILDTNVRRVLGRIVLGPEGPRSAPATLWTLARETLPADNIYDWNQALMDLGARVCMERRPTCLLCPAQPWCASAGKVVPTLRERPADYVARPQVPFAGSTRYYRGRIVERLRALEAEDELSLELLGAAVKPDYTADDLPWLRGLVERLARDGLLRTGETGTVRLP